ncbi:cytochrome b [Undibacterium cyanobacteriorum]|uniref:Cytochrome b n=1 Tax=Undibacterium cyanobacteriorum TaxID=3073561 RepID=A0ABY9RDH8_9BURK|nr:cytochrome b [Undibacterium sp. 20NA77.5]WMW79295.1 cytochrome b [Undibacterium sp. 20NA77.5]
MAIQRLSKLTISLHWIIAATMIVLLAVGIYMAETDAWALYPWHKSFGILIFPVAVARVLWRIKEGWPEPVGDYPRYEQILAKLTHYALLLGTLLMPISGMVFSSMSGHGFELFGIPLAAAHPSPDKPGEVVPVNESLADFAHEAHEVIGWILILAIALHVIGALKHHVIDKDQTLQRMRGKMD